MQCALARILSDFLRDVFLILFINVNMSMELFNGENPIAPPSVLIT